MHKTPSLDAPMTDEEVEQAFNAWYNFRAGVAARAPQTMLEMLEMLSPITGEIFDLRKKLTDIWRHAEDRHYGRLDVVKPFRRGVSPKTKVAAETRSFDQILSDLNMTAEELYAEMDKIGGHDE